MTERVTTSPRHPKHLRNAVWFLCGLLLLVSVGTAINVFPKSTIERDVINAGGIFMRSDTQQSGLDRFINIIFNGTRRDPSHVINLSSVSIDDAWLKDHRQEISELTHLYLLLDDTAITHAGINELRGMDNIDRLEVAGTRLSSESLKTIATMSQAGTVKLPRTGIPGQDFDLLKPMKHLAHLGMDGEQAVNGGVAALSQLTTVQSVEIEDATDDVARVLQLTPLKYVVLRGESLTDASVPFLSQMPKVELLTLIDSSISPEQIKILEAALPNCQVQPLTQAQIDKAFADYRK